MARGLKQKTDQDQLSLLHQHHNTTYYSRTVLSRLLHKFPEIQNVVGCGQPSVISCMLLSLACYSTGLVPRPRFRFYIGRANNQAWYKQSAYASIVRQILTNVYSRDIYIRVLTVYQISTCLSLLLERLDVYMQFCCIIAEALNIGNIILKPEQQVN